MSSAIDTVNVVYAFIAPVKKKTFLDNWNATLRDTWIQDATNTSHGAPKTTDVLCRPSSALSSTTSPVATLRSSFNRPSSHVVQNSEEDSSGRIAASRPRHRGSLFCSRYVDATLGAGETRSHVMGPSKGRNSAQGIQTPMASARPTS